MKEFWKMMTLSTKIKYITLAPVPILLWVVFSMYLMGVAFFRTDIEHVFTY